MSTSAARQPFRVAVMGDRIDLTDAELARSAQVAHIPHDRMGTRDCAACRYNPHGRGKNTDGSEPCSWCEGTGRVSALAEHQRSGSCSSLCDGLWRVLVIESGKVTHVWNAPSQRTAEACCKRLRRYLADGLYPMDPSKPSRITLGPLEDRTDAKGRLRIPKP